MNDTVPDTKPMFDSVRDLSLAAGHYAIFGSGPLWVRGIIATCNDVDVICDDDAWKQVCAVGELKYLPDYGVEIASLDSGRVTFGTSWGIGNLDVNEMIASADFIDGLPYVALRYVERYKRIRNSAKDIRHLAALAAWRSKQQS